MTQLVFALSGFLLLSYAAYLVHKKIEVQVAHAMLFVAGAVVALMPFLNVTVNSNGDVILAIDALNATAGVTNKGAEAAISAINDVQNRLTSVSAEIETRLSALEKVANASPPQGSQPLQDVAAQPAPEQRALEEQQQALEAQQRAIEARNALIEQRLLRMGAF